MLTWFSPLAGIGELLFARISIVVARRAGASFEVYERPHARLRMGCAGIVLCQ
jgi:hypothetical protein